MFPTNPCLHGAYNLLSQELCKQLTQVFFRNLMPDRVKYMSGKNLGCGLGAQGNKGSF